MKFHHENLYFIKQNQHGAEMDAKVQNIGNSGNGRNSAKCAEMEKLEKMSGNREND